MLLSMALCMSAFAQQRTVKFTGRDRTNQYRVKLDRVEIFNLDQLWEEVVYWPDTTLIMGTVGIDDYETQANVQLMRNVPNPFNGRTEFVLILPEGRNVRLELFDMTGKFVTGEDFSDLPAGTHLFEATVMSPQTYLLSATVKDGRMTLKMINEGHGGANAIRYMGMTDSDGNVTVYLKNDCASSSYPFTVGDIMQYTGYATIDGIERESTTVTKSQTNNETIPLLFDVTVPSVTTLNIVTVTGHTATINSQVTDDGGVNVTQRGLCWSASQNPTINNSHTTTDGSGMGNYTSNLTELTPGTTYYVRAYATNSVGTAYGAQLSFTTHTPPIVTTNAVNDITHSSAICGGNVTSDGGTSIIARGVCWSTSQYPTISNDHTSNGNGMGIFTSNISGLTPNTTYYVRAYATNSEGTAYGEQKTFTTTCNTVTIAITGTITINYGQSTTLTASGANIYQWSTGATTASVTVSPTSTITYTVTGTNSYGCTATASKTVIVNPIIPTVITNEVSNIATTSVTCGGNVTSNGGANVTAKGVCWSTAQNPTISDSYTVNGSGVGSFSSSITGLTPNTTYYVRAYATNSVGTAYGEQKTLTTTCNTMTIAITGTPTINYGQSTTLTASGANSYHWNTGANTTSITVSPTSTTTYTVTGTNSYGCTATASKTVTVNPIVPTVTTSNVSNITTNSASCGGNVTSNGGANVTARGVCWSTSQNPTISNGHTTNGSGNGSFSSSITGLTPNTTYYVRAYATNSAGTAYGEMLSFTTLCSNTTGDTTAVECDSFIWHGVEYTETPAVAPTYTYHTIHGCDSLVTLHLTVKHSIIHEIDTVVCSLPIVWNGLTFTEAGTHTITTTNANGCDSIFTIVLTVMGYPTISGAPEDPHCEGVTIGEIIENITITNADEESIVITLDGEEVDEDYVVTFNPDGYWLNITCNSGYEQCAVGHDYDFSVFYCGAPCPGTPTITDYDGNIYNTVQIGDQCWMRENLRTTHFSDGTAIPAGGSAYSSTTEPYYYVNSVVDASIFGYYYNWPAAVDACPAGWHLPSDAEWTQLTDYVSGHSDYTCGGDNSYIAKALTSTSGWNIFTSSCCVGNDQSSNNASGFAAVPSGYGSLSFYYRGEKAYFWSSTEYGSNAASSRLLSYASPIVNQLNYNRYFGLSVRCLRDETGTAVIDEYSCPAAPTVTDHEGNVYATVQIGNQCWMRDNLRTTTSPSTGTYLIPAAGTGTTYTGKQAFWYNNDSATYAPMNYGLLYNWNAAVDTFNTAYGETSVNASAINAVSVSFTSYHRGICPTGWHLPSNTEWTILTNYVRSQNEYTCDGIYIAKALADSVGWSTSNDDTCHVGYNQSSNNATGFSAIPAGAGLWPFSQAGSYAHFWSSTQANCNGNDCVIAWDRGFGSFSLDMDGIGDYKSLAFSVRCLRDDTATAVIDEKSCPAAPTVTDHEGNVYATVQIGNQCWMRENLRTTHYSDGTPIPAGSDTSSITAYRYYPNNDSTYVYSYGYLYNWKAVMRNSSSSDANPSGVQGICPTGWHVPSKTEWLQLKSSVKSQSQNICGSGSGDHIYYEKSLAYVMEWDTCLSTCTIGNIQTTNNATGFSAVPAGCYSVFNNYFNNMGTSAAFWSSSLDNNVGFTTNEPASVVLFNCGYSSFLTRSDSSMGLSVRCVHNPQVITSAVSSVTETSANCGGFVTEMSSTPVTARGVCWNTSDSPTVSDYHTTNGSGIGNYSSNITGLSAGTTYYVRAYATNNEETIYGNQQIFTTLNVCPSFPTVIDVDENIYNTVQIGNQCWMRENLRTSHFADGTPIPTGFDTSSTNPYYYDYIDYCYNNDYSDYISSNFPLTDRGYLYNWSAAMLACPTGWHLPSDAEWIQLINYVSGLSYTYMGKALASTYGWYDYDMENTIGSDQSSNNVSGLSIFPAGSYERNTSLVNDGCLGVGDWTLLWSSTEQNDGNSSWGREIRADNSVVHKSNYYKSSGFSVRCLRDAGTAVIDEKSCPSTPTVTDHEGNVYATVQIGNQCWMRDNLRTTTSPTTGTYLIPSANTGYTYTGKQARWYNNDSATYAPMNYGLLYNWNAAVDTFNTAYGETSVNASSANGVNVSFTGNCRGICPAGWHLPSNAEWTQFTNYVRTQGDYICGDTNINIAKALASTEGWNTSTNNCAVGNDPSTNNASGFTAVPAGRCDGSLFHLAGINATFWSSSQLEGYSDGALHRYLYYSDARVNQDSHNKAYCRSVRCLRE